jgi:pyruvate formate lyase activating enzyme
MNDDRTELEALARWLVAELGAETPWHVSRFFPAYQMADAAPTPLRTIIEAAEIGRQAGLRHVYPGNVAGVVETHCAGCGETLIRRSDFTVLGNRLRDGSCPLCGRRLPGLHLEEHAQMATAS